MWRLYLYWHVAMHIQPGHNEMNTQIKANKGTVNNLQIIISAAVIISNSALCVDKASEIQT